MSKIINLNGNAVELENIKAISHNSYHRAKPETNQLKIEFKTRKEYIYNPGSKQWELETFNDVLLVDYPDHDAAVDNYLEIMDIWKEALEEKA